MKTPAFGYLTNPTAEVLGEIERIRKMGFDYPEICIEEPEGSPEILMKKRNQILKLLKKFNRPPLAHMWWCIDLGSYYKHVREGWMNWSKQAIYTAAELGCISATFHTHARSMFRTRAQKLEIMKNWVEALKGLVKYGKKKGVKIYLENPAEKWEISDFASFKWIADRVPGLFVHVDVGHALVNGGEPEKWLRTFSKKLAHIHIHDNRGKQDEHMPLGCGNLDYKGIARLLKKMKYDKTITFEVFNPAGMATDSLEKMRALF